MLNKPNIKTLIKQANKSEFHPTQDVFASAAVDFVHHTPPQPKIQKKKLGGHYKRHLERKARGVKQGFGKGYSAREVVFRVEFSWLDLETGDESNEQIHWVLCRKFQDKEYKFLKKYFAKEKPRGYLPGETVESEFALRYVATWLIENREKEHLNQAFLFPSPKIGNDTIRSPLYEARWTSELPGWAIDDDLAIMLKKNIWHQCN